MSSETTEHTKKPYIKIKSNERSKYILHVFDVIKPILRPTIISKAHIIHNPELLPVALLRNQATIVSQFKAYMNWLKNQS